jgi:hypothetical protein
MIHTNTHSPTSEEAGVEEAACITWADVRGNVVPPEPLESYRAETISRHRVQWKVGCRITLKTTVILARSAGEAHERAIASARAEHDGAQDCPPGERWVLAVRGVSRCAALPEWTVLGWIDLDFASFEEAELFAAGEYARAKLVSPIPA